MNPDTQTENTERQTLAARIINALADEILLRIDSRTNGALIGLSDRIAKLEREMGKSPSLDHLDDFVTLVEYRALRATVEEIDGKIEDIEYKVRDLEDEKVSSDDLEDTVRDAVEMAQSRQAASAVREGIKAIMDGKI
jgi:predicted component of type VI protein secretion system